jgi:hypothetical protein
VTVVGVFEKKMGWLSELAKKKIRNIPILQVFLVFQPNHQIHYFSLHCLTLQKICSIWFNKRNEINILLQEPCIHMLNVDKKSHQNFMFLLEKN